MPTGELPPVALRRLAETGEWMKVNAESIHDTMPQARFQSTTRYIQNTLPPSLLMLQGNTLLPF